MTPANDDTILRDCGQKGVCRTPPGCARHWEERNRELVRDISNLHAAMDESARLIDNEISQWLDHKSRAYPVLRKAFEILVNAMEECRGRRGL